jgi:hypothetical protein
MTHYTLKLIAPDQWTDEYHYNHGYQITACYSDDDPLATSPFSVIRLGHGFMTAMEAQIEGNKAMVRILAGDAFNQQPRSIVA